MRRMERRHAQKENRTPHTLAEINYLLLVDDEVRQGALRFAEKDGGPFLREKGDERIPPVVELPRLLTASEHFLEEKDTDEDLRLLFAPGSSLGGARPKASVKDKDGLLAIAKFPRKDDEFNVVIWEAVALALAKKAKVTVPATRIERVANKSILLLRRFDRDGDHRIPFLSAMSMLGARDHETRSYLEIADALRQYGANPTGDLEALWQRIVFNILVSNTDDHLRNHGFLLEGSAGWLLSPVYDVNPVPTDVKPRILSTTINEDDGTASLSLAMEVASYFGLNATRARAIIAETGRAVSSWRKEAVSHGLGQADTDRMASAFEHEDLRLACEM